MPYAQDETDLRIVRQLQLDGRMSIVDMARALGMPEATVRKRLERLLAQKVVRVVGLPDMAAVGVPLAVIVSLTVEMSQIEATARAIAALPEVRWLTYTTGPYDLIMEASFADNDQLLAFLSQRLAAIPGIRSATTSHVLRNFKAVADWRLPSEQVESILVVDDDADFRDMTRTVLESAGYRVLTAASGNEALATLRRQHPSLVVLDVMMEGLLDGLDATRAMRLDANLKRIPIIMVSSIASSEYADQFPTDEYIAADAFLSKPINPARLIEEVRRLIAERG